MPLQEDDFSDIPAATAAGSARDWDFTSDSPASVAIFNTGSLQDIELFAGNGQGFVKRSDAPSVIHQRVEAVMPLATVKPGTAYSGVFARYVDVNNYVLARFDHAAAGLIAVLIERIAGVNTTLATAPLTAASDVTGVSLRMELVGQRARLFFENHYRPIPDQPPDIAANLAGTYTVPGEWGIYLDATGTNNVAVSRFSCRELPSEVATAPTLSAVTASGTYSLTAFTATVSDVPASAVYLEWEIYPVDSEDFPDPYRELALDSMTTRVFFGRPGYTYDVRVRTVKKSGGYGDWVTERITVTGSQTLPSAETMPTDEFPDVTPDYVLDRTTTADTGTLMAETGRERVTTHQPAPRDEFSLVFKARARDEILLIENFFLKMRGRLTPWVFTHPITGDEFAVRFATDDLSPVAIDDEYDGTGPICDLEFGIVAIKIGVVQTITLSLAVDASLVP